MSHVPVMLDEALAALSVRAGGVYVDATFGAGGYSRAILEAADSRVLALDRDPCAARFAQPLQLAFPDRFALVQAPFSTLDRAVLDADLETVDGVVFDIGVSSMQLDDPGRGFSFRADGPLDMRMGRDGPSAADLVATLELGELARVLRDYGEERHARRVAQAIVRAREDAPITTTARLAQIVERVLGAGEGRIHPATRTFQGLRIAVNDELGELETALGAAERVLAPGGRLVVVSFHSLEDRIVKRFLRDRAGLDRAVSRHAPEAAPGPEPTFRLVQKSAVEPSEAETVANPRARSAKLRAGERTDAPIAEARSRATS